MALAVAALHEREVGRLILTRPAVEAGERLGFLPGDMLAKVDPYLRPLVRRPLRHARGGQARPRTWSAGSIEVAPLAFMRGRTLNDSFIILDEAQNTSPEQMQMFLTRLGFGSKIVVTGDVTQIDLPRDQASGPDPGSGHPQHDRRHRVHPFRQRGRRPAQARAADRRGVQVPRGGNGHGPAEVVPMVEVEVANRSGAAVDEAGGGRARSARARRGGHEDGEVGLVFVRADEARRSSASISASTRPPTCSPSPSTAATQCRTESRARSATSSSAPKWSAPDWREPLIHGALHLVGYDHGDEMAAREEALAR